MNFLSNFFTEEGKRKFPYPHHDPGSAEAGVYSLPQMLDVGLKVLQLNTKNKINIMCAPVDPTEKEDRLARLERRKSKDERKAMDRETKKEIHRRVSQASMNSEFSLSSAIAATDEKKVNISLSESLQGSQSIETFKTLSLEEKIWGPGAGDAVVPPDYHQWAMMAPQPIGLNIGGFQTVMLRNIPNKYTRTQLLKRLNVTFKGEFDFLYIPIDFNNKCNVGYAFINFKRPENVPRFLEFFNGVKAIRCLPDYNSTKICEVTPAHVQGLEQNIEHIRNSPICEQLRSRPDWQPLLFDAKGEPMPFPLKTKKKNRASETESGGRTSTQSRDTAQTKNQKKRGSELTVEEANQGGKKGKEGDKVTRDSAGTANDEEKESFPKKEKRRKEKNKRTSMATEKRELGPCLIDSKTHTTAMVRYMPEELTRKDLCKTLERVFSKGSYDFLYMPIDFEKNNNVGYFFINFTVPSQLNKCVRLFHNIVAKDVFKSSSCTDNMEVSPARVQGLETNINNLKNSSVGMVGQSNLEWKPLLFGNDGSMQEMDLQPRKEVARKSKISEGDDAKKRDSKKSAETSTTEKKSARDSETSKKSKTKKDGRANNIINLYPQISNEMYYTPMEEAHTTDYANFKTVMLRNLPNKYTRKMLQEHLDKVGFKKMYDFLYMPIDFRNKCNVGYAFLNFRTNEGVKKCFKYFQGVECANCLPGFNSNKIVEVMPARVQGLEENVRHLQNSSIIEQLQDKPDSPEWQPLVMDKKNRPIAFPWTEVTQVKMNPEANVFLPGMPSHDEDTSARWMFAMEYMFRSSLRPFIEPQWNDPSMSQPVNPTEHRSVMIRNIPNKFTRDKLVEKLIEVLPKNCIDFFYMPIDFANKCNVGYCFVNFRTTEGVRRCMEKFHNVESRVCLSGFNSSKVVVVTAARVQGLQANISHLQTSSVFETLKERGLDEWAPLVYNDKGEIISFPEAVADLANQVAPGSRKSKKKKSISSAESNETAQTSVSGFQDRFSLFYGQVMPGEDPENGTYTSVMIRNLPYKITRDKFLEILDTLEYKKEIDFCYLPVDTKIKQNIGYAFLNFRDVATVAKFVTQFNHNRPKGLSGSKPLEITPSRVQGKDNNVRYLHNSHVLDELEGFEDWAPLVFQKNGTSSPVQPLAERKNSLRADAPEFLPKPKSISRLVS